MTEEFLYVRITANGGIVMDLFRLKIVKLLISLHIPLYKDPVILWSQDKDFIIEYIFRKLDVENASLFYLSFSSTFKDTFVTLLKPHFKTVIKSIACPLHYIEYCKQRLGSPFILSHLEDLSLCLSKQQYLEIMNYLYEKDCMVQKKLRHLDPILYQFYDALESSDQIPASCFSTKIIFPLSQIGVDQYLEFLKKHLFLGRNLEITYLNCGSSKFAFDVNGIVMKFGYHRSVFPIYLHYRMNDFYVRKRISTKYGYLDIEASPKGILEEVTELDIKEALIDLKQDSFIVRDRNYKGNFALFKEEPDLYFRDVEGILGYDKRHISEAYQKRKVKLIDHEYVYKNN